MIKVRVPATSANLGPGYDCMGVALKLYNYIEAEEIESGLEIVQRGAFARYVPVDERNLVYRSMVRVFEETGCAPKGLRITITSNIPATRGLGSSAACICGGMVAANAFYGKLGLSDILRLATEAEGHPDNVTPCLVGGLTAAVREPDGRVLYAKAKLERRLKLAVFSPEFILPTKKARDTLPEMVSHKDAAFNLAHSTLLFASLMSGKYENIPFAMDDRLHQPYRRELIDGLDEIFDACRQNGALGCYISGAGPSLAAVLDGKCNLFKKEMSAFLSTLSNRWALRVLDIDNDGIFVKKEDKNGKE